MATKKTGITLAAEGEKEFRQAISNINSQMKVLSSEMKKVTTEFADNANGMEALTAKNKVLEQQQTSYKEKIVELNKIIKSGTDAQSLQSTKIEEWKNKISQAKTALDQYKNSENASTEEITKQEKALSTLKTELSQMESNYSKLSNKTNGWKTTLNNTEASLNKTTSEIKSNKASMEVLKNPTEEVAKDIKEVGNSAKDSQPKILKMADVLKANLLSNAITSGLKSLANGFKELVKEGLSFDASMEQYKTSFEVMTGSEEKATEVTEKLKQVAADTPFEINDLADTTQLLMNYGLTADDSITKMNMLGDISQGSADKMNRIATAYGQMSSAGKVQLEDVKQMIEAGFNPLQEISQTTGESMASLYDRISKGTISVNEITASMERSTSEGGKYFQSMDKQSQTLNGRMSTLKDTISNKLGDAMESTSNRLANEILPKVTNLIENINVDALANSIANIVDKLVDIASFVTEHGTAILSLVTGIGVGMATWKIASTVTGLIGVFQGASHGLNGVKTSQDGVNASMRANPIMLIVSLIITLITYLVTLYNTNENFRNGVNSIMEDIRNVCSEVVDAVVGFFTETIPNAFNNAKDSIGNIINNIGEFFTNLRNTIVNKAVEIGTGIIDGINSAIDFITGLPGKAIQWGADMIDGMVRGIRSGIGAVGDAVKSVADKITAFLHFSVPDEGPLTKYESWMPDFTEGLAQGIESNQYKVIDKVKKMSTNIKSALDLTSNSGLNYSVRGTAQLSVLPAENTSLVSDFKDALKGVVFEVENKIGEKTLAKTLVKPVVREITNKQQNSAAMKGVVLNG